MFFFQIFTHFDSGTAAHAWWLLVALSILVKTTSIIVYDWRASYTRILCSDFKLMFPYWCCWHVFYIAYRNDFTEKPTTHTPGMRRAPPDATSKRRRAVVKPEARTLSALEDCWRNHCLGLLVRSGCGLSTARVWSCTAAMDAGAVPETQLAA